jgi:hypothetical protein
VSLTNNLFYLYLYSYSCAHVIPTTRPPVYRPHHTIQSDAEALEDAKREAAGLPPLNRGNNRQRDRNETATDDQVYERFKKR